MRVPNPSSDEGRALLVILHTLGEGGRSQVRQFLLARTTDNSNYPDAKHTLDVMNAIERAFDEVARESAGARP